MADLLQNILEIFSLLLGTIPIALVLLVLVWVGSWLRQQLASRFNWSWVMSVLSATLVLLFVILLLAYLVPSGGQFETMSDRVPTALEQLGESQLDYVPVAPESSNVIAGILLVLFRALLAAVILTFLCFPFILVGSILEESLQQKQKPSKKKTTTPSFVPRLVAVYVMTLVGIVVLLVFPWIWAGFAYFLFFS